MKFKRYKAGESLGLYGFNLTIARFRMTVNWRFNVGRETEPTTFKEFLKGLSESAIMRLHSKAR